MVNTLSMIIILIFKFNNLEVTKMMRLLHKYVDIQKDLGEQNNEDYKFEFF